MAEAFAADRGLLEARGYGVRVDLNHPGYIRAVVRRGEAAFVDPADAADAVPHFERPGGVLPRLEADGYQR